MPKKIPPRDNRKALSLDPRIPSDVAELVSCDVINLTDASTFCLRQAKNAALFTEGIEEMEPGHFVLKSPFRENFLASLLLYIYPPFHFKAAETIAYALPRHATWYLEVRDVDRISSRFAEETGQQGSLKPAALKHVSDDPLECWQGFIGTDGVFAIKADTEGTPAILAFQEITGDIASLALEIRGRAVAQKDPTFRKALLESALKEVLLKLGLQRAQRGRPHDSRRAGMIAYARDHEGRGKGDIARRFCKCGQRRHGRQCFRPLDLLADSFYAVQRSRLEKLVKRQGRNNC